MSNTLQGPVALLGRLLIATIFLMSAIGNKIPNFQGVVGYMQSAGVPSPQLLLAGAIVFLIAGGAMLVAGFHARFGASLLLVFLAMATYYFHPFWKLEGQEQQMQMIHFMKNLSMMGTMLFIIAVGPGPWSVDNRRAATVAGSTPLPT